MCVCVRESTLECIYTHTHTYIHTYTHTHTSTGIPVNKETGYVQEN
jgi:hypothetical protein